MPPLHLEFVRLSSGLNKSSELNDVEYSPLKYFIICGRSDWKICVSDKFTKWGLNVSVKCLRLNRFLFKPSQFQVIEESCSVAPVFTGLSELLGLNDHGYVEELDREVDPEADHLCHKIP